MPIIGAFLMALRCPYDRAVTEIVIALVAMAIALLSRFILPGALPPLNPLRLLRCYE